MLSKAAMLQSKTSVTNFILFSKYISGPHRDPTDIHRGGKKENTKLLWIDILFGSVPAYLEKNVTNQSW